MALQKSSLSEQFMQIASFNLVLYLISTFVLFIPFYFLWNEYLQNVFPVKTLDPLQAWGLIALFRLPFVDLFRS